MPIQAATARRPAGAQPASISGPHLRGRQERQEVRQRVPEPYPDFPERPQHFKPNGASTAGGARNGACRVTVMRIGADKTNDDALKTSCLSDAAR